VWICRLKRAVANVDRDVLQQAVLISVFIR